MLENLEYQEMNVIERGWVINIMREIGVTYLALFEVFNEIYEKRVNIIFNNNKHNKYTSYISIDFNLLINIFYFNNLEFTMAF